MLWALHHGHQEIVQYLIAEKASTLGQLCSDTKLGIFSCRGHSAVHIACRTKSLGGFLPFLLDRDQEAGSPAFRGPVNPLHIATAYNNPSAMKILLDHVRGRERRPELPAVATATIVTQGPGIPTSSAQNTSVNLFDLLDSTESICDIQIDGRNLAWDWLLHYPVVGSQGSMPMPITTRGIATGAGLHIAAHTNSVPTGNLLLDYGAKVDLRDANEQTPLHIAASAGALGIVDLLLKHGANPVARDFLGRTPAMLAAKRDHLDVLKTLERYHDPLGQCDIHGFGILHFAGCGHPRIWSYIMSKGFSPYVTNHLGHSPIDIALGNPLYTQVFWTLICNWGLDFERCSKLISRLGINKLNAKSLSILIRRIPNDILATFVNTNNEGQSNLSPLSQAVSCGRFDLLDPLVRAGAKMDLEGGHSGTPLLAACSYGRLPAVKYLVRAGANLFSTRAGIPFTAVQAARDFPGVVQWLLVERYTEQHKLTQSSDYSTLEVQAMSWSGPRSVEVEIDGLYSPTHGASSFIHAVELSELRKQLRGQIVTFRSFMD